jgi:hypothetical protein
MRSGHGLEKIGRPDELRFSVEWFIDRDTPDFWLAQFVVEKRCANGAGFWRTIHVSNHIVLKEPELQLERIR